MLIVGKMFGLHWTTGSVAILIMVAFARAFVETGSFISDLDKPTPTAHVQGVVGRRASLPCDIQSLAPNDRVSMVLWFKESDGEPLYSYDVRGRMATNPKLWSSPNGFATRAFFRATAAPAVLLLDAITPADAGIYRCRVDFKNSPTRNTKLNFSVITPPDRPQILDAKTKDTMKLLEPYNEGDILDIVCLVHGGDPRPRVTWYLENVVIDDSFEQRANGVTLNTLTFPNVGRQHLNARLVCQASNTNLAPPLNKVLILDINLRPLTVQILNKSAHLSADRSQDIECRSTGSRPDAVTTWWKGEMQIKKGVKNFSETNSTMSVLTFTPEAIDHGQLLVCRVHNPRIAGHMLEDKWTLNIHFVPEVTLRLGSSLIASDIKEDDDVYFECSVNSNPKSYKLVWLKGNKEIQHNASAGVILSDQSLVLQRVRRAAAGDYSCVAGNSEGSGTSNTVSLQIRYAPICKSVNEGQVYGALKHEVVTLECKVDSSPEPTRFIWIFNSSGEQSEVSPSAYTNNGLTSTLKYTPTSDLDFGTISCLAHNAVGDQRTPCVYRLIAASTPMPLRNCSIKTQSSGLQVMCTEGFDGGLPQFFYLEILELPNLVIRQNKTSNGSAAFSIEDLDSRLRYALRVYAVNAKGRSEPVTLYTAGTKPPDKYTDSSTSILLSPMLCALAAMGTLLLAAICAAVTVIYRKQINCKQSDDKPPIPSVFGSSVDSISVKCRDSPSYQRYSKESCVFDEEPDLIPCSYDKISPSGNSFKINTGESQKFIDPARYGVRGLIGCDLASSETLHSTARVSRGVTARGADISSSYRPEVVTTNRIVRESCI